MYDYPSFPGSKLEISITDAHVHLDEIGFFPRLTENASIFNIKHFVGITKWYQAETDYTDFERKYPGILRFAFYIPITLLIQIIPCNAFSMHGFLNRYSHYSRNLYLQKPFFLTHHILFLLGNPLVWSDPEYI